MTNLGTILGGIGEISGEALRDAAPDGNNDGLFTGEQGLSSIPGEVRNSLKRVVSGFAGTVASATAVGLKESMRIAEEGDDELSKKTKGLWSR